MATKVCTPKGRNKPTSTKVIKSTGSRVFSPSKAEPEHGFLDKLGYLRKRAKAKVEHTPTVNALLAHAIRLGHHQWVRRYATIMECAGTITRNGDKLTSKYCGSRACKVCNRIRTGRLINEFKPVYEAMVEPFFVTLTAPTVTGQQLKSEIERRLDAFAKVMGCLRKRGNMMAGLRKLEIAYKRANGHLMYHPHFHVLVEGRDSAHALVAEWLKRMPDANKGGQNCTRADIDSLNELFKYTTKETASRSKHDGDGDGDAPTIIHALHTVHLATYRKRTLQTFGNFGKGLRLNSDDDKLMELTAQEYGDICKDDYTMEWSVNDWYGTTTGEALSKYIPTPETIRRSNNVLEFFDDNPPSNIVPDDTNKSKKGKKAIWKAGKDRRSQKEPVYGSRDGSFEPKAGGAGKAVRKRKQAQKRTVYADAFRAI